MGGGSNRGVRYDPKRFTKEFTDHMNSESVVSEHRRVVKSVREYQDRRGEENERNARNFGRQ